MNENNEQQLTDYVLGELDAPAREEVESLIKKDPQMAAAVEELRQTVGMIESVFEAEPKLVLAPEQKAQFSSAIADTSSANTVAGNEKVVAASSAKSQPTQVASPGRTKLWWAALAATLVGIVIGGSFMIRPQTFRSLASTNVAKSPAGAAEVAPASEPPSNDDRSEDRSGDREQVEEEWMGRALKTSPSDDDMASRVGKGEEDAVPDSNFAESLKKAARKSRGTDDPFEKVQRSMRKRDAQEQTAKFNLPPTSAAPENFPNDSPGGVGMELNQLAESSDAIPDLKSPRDSENARAAQSPNLGVDEAIQQKGIQQQAQVMAPSAPSVERGVTQSKSLMDGTGQLGLGAVPNQSPPAGGMGGGFGGGSPNVIQSQVGLEDLRNQQANLQSQVLVETNRSLTEDFQSATITTQVPFQKMRTEQRSRTVPVTRGGVTAMETQNYSVGVPYTENRTETREAIVISDKVANQLASQIALQVDPKGQKEVYLSNNMGYQAKRLEYRGYDNSDNVVLFAQDDELAKVEKVISALAIKQGLKPEQLKQLEWQVPVQNALNTYNMQVRSRRGGGNRQVSQGLAAETEMADTDNEAQEGVTGKVEETEAVPAASGKGK